MRLTSTGGAFLIAGEIDEVVAKKTGNAQAQSRQS